MYAKQNDPRQSKEIFVDSFGFLTLKSWYDAEESIYGIDVYSDEIFLGEVPGISIDDTNENIEQEILEKLGFTEEMKSIENRQCPCCKEKIDINDFRDELSIKEFTISGLCQSCQDDIFDMSNYGN